MMNRRQVLAAAAVAIPAAAIPFVPTSATASWRWVWAQEVNPDGSLTRMGFVDEPKMRTMHEKYHPNLEILRTCPYDLLDLFCPW